MKKTGVEIAKKISYRDLLANRDYRILISAQGISNFGDWLIIGILVSLVTSLVPKGFNPALALAGLWISKIAPSLFFSPFIGALVDRIDRKKGMIVSDIIRGLFVSLLPLSSVFGGLILVYIVILFSEIFTLFFVPAKDASIPNLVKKEQLIDANSLSFTINQVTMLLGLGVGTTIILLVNRVIMVIPFIRGLAGTFTAVYIDAFTFFLSASILAFINLPKKKKEKHEYPSIIEEVKDTFRFIAANPKIKSIIISAGFSVLGLGTILIVGPQYTQETLKMGKDGFLILLTLLAVGLVIGAISSSWLSHMISKESLFSSSLSIVGLSLVAFAIFSSITVAIILGVVSGFALGILYVTAYTIFHEQVSDLIRGRLFTALEADLRLALILSFLVTSGVASLIGNQRVTILSYTFFLRSFELVMFGGGVIVFTASLYAFKETRRITGEIIIEKIRSRKNK